ncbi:hypothetical protein [Pedobacter helvus]|uniref:Uncharacterized protein n=1 Tax=Pedobacter helvus TaxID=2563444 RepID=A0ABW9JMI1_9SPHI|nr:hypothetical protein [Pedobacter ureilyticus]
MSEALKEDIKDWSWEVKLKRYLGEGKRADLYIFDHGHNDNFSYLSNPKDMDSIPDDSRNRSYYIGAMNFIIDRILEDNPRARICIIGHYENQKKPIISKGQKKLAEYWNFPLFELWSRLGWSQQKIKTTSFWKDKKTWISTGAPLQKKQLHKYGCSMIYILLLNLLNY